MLSLLKLKKFNNLIQDHLDSLLQFSYMRCKDRELAEDLAQETCIKAYKAYCDKKEEITNPKEWLFKILINTHIDYLRKRKFNTESIYDKDFVSNNNPIDQVESNIFFESINKALNNLESGQRMVVYLADIKDYSIKKIAELMNIPIGTVVSRLHRARKILRELLTKEEQVKELQITNKVG